MPTPDSSSTEVYLIHDLGLERCFWAYWPSLSDWRTHFPQVQTVIEGSDTALRSELQRKYPGARELELDTHTKRQLYRQIQRAVLPEAVRIQIAAALELQRQQQQALYLAAGFEAQDLENLGRLKQRYRQLAQVSHPDRGGDPERFKALQLLYQQARRRLLAHSARIR